MWRGLTGLALSLVLHAFVAAILVGLWPNAPPVPDQAMTPTKMLIGVMRVDAQMATATAPEAPPAEAATPSAPRTTEQGVPVRRSPAVQGIARPAEAVGGIGARVSPVSEAIRGAPAAPAPSARVSAVPAASKTARETALDKGPARLVPPRSEPRPEQALASVMASPGVMRAEALASVLIPAPTQAPSASAPSPTTPGVVPLAKVGANLPLASVALSSVSVPAETGSSIRVVAAERAQRARAPSSAVPSVAPPTTILEPSPSAPLAALPGAARVGVAALLRPIGAAPPEVPLVATIAEAVTARAARREPRMPEAAMVQAVPAETVAILPGAVRAGGVAPTPPPATALARLQPDPVFAQAAPPRAAALRPAVARPVQVRRATVAGAAIPTLRIDAPGVAASAPAGRRLTAALDWSGAVALRLDAGGLAALRAFLTPEAPQGRAVRDGMAAVLAAPDCARLHTVFDPQTGALALRGHVPEAADAAQLIAALRGEIGDTLPLRDELRVLPDPQCSLIDGLARLNLPQSEEQLTNPNHVGENAFVREYDFSEGDWFVVELGTPDYPAYLYVDYFDSSGQVLHLTPNARLPLAFHPPASPVVIGRDDSFRLRIAPPFGQDIVVAFAASRPLYDGLRPTAEPAGPYLDWMRGRVAAARAANPNFKGEWVYLFVASHAAGP